MFTKRPLPHDKDSEPPSLRLRANIADLFLQNDISGTRAQSIFSDGHACGLEGFRKLAEVGGKVKVHKQNIARGMRRNLIKGSHWPQLYYAQIRVWNKRSQQETTTWLPFLLPHELLASFLKLNPSIGLCQTGGLSANALRNFNDIKRKLNETEMVALGIWGDGCPCNWDRTESVEVLSMNFPGIEEWNHLRMPLTVISKKYLIVGNTFDDMLDVISWSLRACATGVYPTQRHDECSFLAHDAKRKKLAGKPIGIKAALCEVRGDWMFLSDVFRLPAWNSKAGCCFKCTVTPETIKQCGAEAPWRTSRLDHFGNLERMLQQGKRISPLFAAPHFSIDMFAIDWLHCADHGITADFLGNLFFLLLGKVEGRNRTQKVQNLWLKLQDWYARNGVEDRLEQLKVTMIKQQAKAPKLRSKAAQARALVPFAKEISMELLSDDHAIEHAAKHCAIHLDACYSCLSSSAYDSVSLAENCRKFCILYCGLSDITEDKAWRVKPKLHMFQELCEMSGWTYRDEDFGGSIAKYSRSRGGKDTPLSKARNVLTVFLAKNKIPVLE
jgi:hypothetical protein